MLTSTSNLAPSVKQVAVLRSLAIAAGPSQFGAIQASASSLGGDANETERAVTAFASVSNGSMIVTGGSSAVHRELIITLAARHRLPATFPARHYVTGGGLVSYAPDRVDQYRRAAS
jgi:putative tryptophan/tyrosine transport system substrate-binding protein